MPFTLGANEQARGQDLKLQRFRGDCALAASPPLGIRSSETTGARRGVEVESRVLTMTSSPVRCWMSLIAAGLVQAAGWRYTGQRVLLCCVVFMFRALWREGYETKDTLLFVFASTLFLVN